MPNFGSGMDDLKVGFWVGLGLALALAVWGLVQLLLDRVVKRNG